ncbi:MAG: hypothetical protein II797_02770 [Clostridia bacterium]|nr:hypothetical protein [Clostridia bacterium]
MKLSGLSPKTAALGLTGLSLAGALLLYFAFASDSFQSLTVRHFSSVPATLVVGIVLLVLTAAAGLVLTFLMKKRTVEISEATPLPLVPFAVILVILLLASVYFDFTLAKHVDLTSTSATKNTYVALLKVRGVLGALSVPSFLLILFPSVKKEVNSWLGLVPILWALLTLLSHYFNSTLALNDPEKTLLLILSAALMLQTVGEARLRIPEKKESFLIYWFVGAALGLSLSFLFLLAHIVSLFSSSTPFALPFHTACLSFFLSLFSLIRFLTVKTDLPEAEAS